MAKSQVRRLRQATRDFMKADMRYYLACVGYLTYLAMHPKSLATTAKSAKEA